MTKGHINFLIAGSCAVLIGWMILMVLFPEIVFINTDEPDELITDTVEVDFSVSTSNFDKEIEYKPTPKTKSLKMAKIEREGIAEETTAETETTEPIEETTKKVEETTVIEEKTAQIVDVKTSSNTYLGNFLLTAYCPCSYCCGKSDGITATGTKATAGRTIAVDPRIIPYGSQVEINGHIYTAEDCGGAIKSNKIDIFFNTHQEALNFGTKYADVYLIWGTK